MSHKPRERHIERNVALCYIRQSQTRDSSDMDSPDRQRAIQAVCDQHGWKPEWYEDAKGHMSGTKVENRPGWMALRARLGDPDVSALVANDLARLHRKGWRVGDLLDFVDEHDVNLVLAAPGKQMDFSTPQGRIVAQLSAIFDEWYAVDIAQRAKDSIIYRKRRGITVGLPPFGTIRGKDGFLRPSPEGAWLLPDGTYVAGKPDDPTQPNVIWRSYFDCAEYILKTYTENKRGVDAIAYKMQSEGWPFRDRSGNPRPMQSEDVRRVIANWAEYGGYVSQRRARERHALDTNIEEIQLIPDRAAFPIELLYRVARVRRERSTRRTVDDSVKQVNYPYSLSGLTYCAHCEALAKKHNNPKLRSRLSGKGRDKRGRYRHKHGVKCAATNRSVLAREYEADFAHLLELLTVRVDEVNILTELGIQAARNSMPPDEVDYEAQKLAAITKCQRRIEAARRLYLDGDLGREEYLRRKEQNEREIVHWESRTTETEQITLELAMCVDAINKLSDLWENGDDEDRQGMVRSLFSRIIYDLDTRRIVDFRLKPWADRFIVLRSSLYGDKTQKPSFEAFQEEGSGVAPTRLELVSSP